MSEGRAEYPSALRRRARWLLAFCLAVDVAVVVYMLSAPIRSDAVNIVLLALMLLGAPVMFWLTRPLQEHEAEAVIAAERSGEAKKLSRWQQALLLLAPLAVTVVAWRYVLDDAWRPSLARATAIVAYFAMFFALGRWHRLGVAPYLRPRFWGFLVAGAFASAVWSLAAGKPLLPTLISGTVSYPLVHYAWVRFSMRRIEQRHLERREGA